MTFEELAFEQLKTESDLEAVAAELLAMAKADPKIGMAVIDAILDFDDCGRDE